MAGSAICVHFEAHDGQHAGVWRKLSFVLHCRLFDTSTIGQKRALRRFCCRNHLYEITVCHEGHMNGYIIKEIEGGVTTIRYSKG
eukprot:scaffold2166_cov43-Cyclotella_meneghiniana.AAC.1